MIFSANIGVRNSVGIFTSDDDFVLFFLISSQTIDCWYTFEPPQ